MSARVEFLSTPAHVFVPTLSLSPNLVPTGGQAHAHLLPALRARVGPFISYPPEYKEQDSDNDEDDEDEDVVEPDEKLCYTYNSFCEEPIVALSINTRDNDTWTVCVEVPLPDFDCPTLLALDYMIKYATTSDTGNSTIQIDTILTQQTIPDGVVTDSGALGVYMNERGFAPRMINHNAALRLSTMLAVKNNGTGEQWNHYVENQRITPNVRVSDGDSRLYVVLHVCEYPTVRTVRSLAVQVSSTWQKKEVERKAKEEAKRKAEEEAKAKEKEETERKTREAEEKQAREEERDARADEKEEREAAGRERKDAEQFRKEEREEWKAGRAIMKEQREEWKAGRDIMKGQREEWKEASNFRKEQREEWNEASDFREEQKEEWKEASAFREEQSIPVLPSKANAPQIADKHLQKVIEQKLIEAGDTCSSGYAFKKTAWGYQCEGGSHKITFVDLGMK